MEVADQVHVNDAAPVGGIELLDVAGDQDAVGAVFKERAVFGLRIPQGLLRPLAFGHLAEELAAIGEFDKALAACQRAVKLKPEDSDLAEAYKNLSAELTMARGRYDGEGDFRHSIKNRSMVFHCKGCGF